MKKTLTLNYIEHDTLSELPDKDRLLVEQARLSARDAYAPYSKFHVGAAVLLENGEVITGNNQENAAYPSGLCAERVAVYYAMASRPKIAIEAIAITALSDDSALNTPPFPCGACRQVLAEYEYRQKKPIRFILHAQSEKTILMNGVDNLLPFPFVSN
ncbi:MAG: cytidine deaminase [Bacteroidales bacterium]|jgi:cytidine deaminase|nr:cytidine deaminase [Bacteroidales bacterium]